MRGRQGRGVVFPSLQLRIPQLSTPISRKLIARESPDLSHGPAAEADAVWVVGDEFANDGLVGIAPAIARATASTTVRARGCSLRKSQNWLQAIFGTDYFGRTCRYERNPDLHFQCRTFGRSVTSPEIRNDFCRIDLWKNPFFQTLAKRAFGKYLGKNWFAVWLVIIPDVRHFGKKRRRGKKPVWQSLAKRLVFLVVNHLPRGCDVIGWYKPTASPLSPAGPHGRP